MLKTTVKKILPFFKDEDGTATVMALLIMLLLMGFVTLALTRTASETLAVSNEISENKALFAAQASLESMALKADVKFEHKLNLNLSDVSSIESLVPTGYDDYNFQQTILKTKSAEIVDATGEKFQGLKMLRDEWQVSTTATEKSSGVKVALRRRFFNNRIPIFQFGIFYEDDLEFHPGPKFAFGGRVHSNGNLFMMAGTGLYFSSKVSAKGEIITDVARNGTIWSHWGDKVFVKNGIGNDIQLKNNMGSVLKSAVNGPNIFSSKPDMPVAYKSAGWEANRQLFQGNLLANQEALNLPLKIADTSGSEASDYIQLIKRGKNVGDLYNDGTGLKPVTASSADPAITKQERFSNKYGIRISLADSKSRLPGCATGVGISAVTTACGIRLDGDDSGDGSEPGLGEARGYQPKPMSDGYTATRINGERIYVSGRQVWIKVETVTINPADSSIVTQDITQDFLSLGLTEKAPTISTGANVKFQVKNYGTKDSRSVIQLQRFIIQGTPIVATDTNYLTSFSAWNGNVVISEKDSSDSASILDNGFSDQNVHMYDAIVDDNSKNRKVSPFPIEMFDTREGLYNEDLNATAAANYGTTKVPYAGVMSMVDINVENLRNFLNGDLDSKMPISGTPYSIANGKALSSVDIPQANGWVLYISDRRGDGDFDGEYDMEDIYGNNDGIKQNGEDVNFNNILDTDYANEAVRYLGTSNSVIASYAATVDHSFYRRGVRLVKGTVLPGVYNATNSAETKGFTVASENGVYVLGNYNATGVTSVGSPSPSTNYLPQNTAQHIPAAIIADAITILSNNWDDAKSFRYPFAASSRSAANTTIRFAMMAGDALSSKDEAPNQGGGDPRLGGGIHNFKRFLEDWSGDTLSYSGSLINLYNARNNNGAFKCCGKVYQPPARNWVFDTTFLDPTRLPPGTPYLQNITLTGFERVND